MTNEWRPFAIDEVIPPWAEREKERVAQALRDTAPRSKGAGGGQFANSIDAQVVGEEIHGEGDAVPGHFLMTGTEAHEIPMPSGYVAFEDAGGETVIRRVDAVHHPGTQPSDFVDRAIEDIETEVGDDLLDGIAALWAAGG